MNMNLQEPPTSPLSAEEVLARVRQLYAQLRLVGQEGTNRHGAAYKTLESEIRRWADRYTEMSAAGINPTADGLARLT